VRRLALLVALLAATLAAGAGPAGATNECRGLLVCVPVAGPWVVVPVAKSVPRPRVQYQLSCPRGFVVAGLDAELSDRAIDIAFFGASGSPVSPGVTTSRSVVFVGSYVGAGARAPTFRPHAGCVPATGGGQRTPTGTAAVFPPGQPTVRRVVTARVTSMRRIVAACRADERLVAWYSARGFFTEAPPSAALVGSLSTRAHPSGDSVVVVAHARGGQGAVQVAAVCAGGR
jgi:hypothetical protein